MSRDPAEAAPVSPLERLGWRLAIPLGLGLLAFLGLALVADLGHLLARLREFDLRRLGPVLALSLVNYALRFVRWQVYLRALGVDLAGPRSLAVFLVGFLLSVTPGKAGELGKAWLVRELGGGPARRVVPAVLAERLTDLAGVVLLVAAGALAFPGGWILALGGALAVAVGMGLLAWERGAAWLLGRLERLPWLGPKVAILEEVYDRLRRLVRGPILAGSLALSVLAWGAEGVGFGLVVRFYEPAGGYLESVFGYALSTLLGAASMLPGGLLAAEGTLAALLGIQGLPAAAAASATLIIRAATLWFAVLLGLLALPRVLRWLARRPPDPEA